MSERWAGLHNPQLHESFEECDHCGACEPDWWCRCCFVAEVETLRARAQKAIELHSHTYLDEKGRDMCTTCLDEESPCPTLRALGEGGDA